MLDLTQSWDDIAAFLSLLAEVLRPGGDVAEVLGPPDDVAFLSLLAEVLGPGDDEAAFLEPHDAGENYVVAVVNDGAFRPDLPKPFNLADYVTQDNTASLSVGAGENFVLAAVSCAAFRPDLPKPLNLADYLAHEAAFLSLLKVGVLCHDVVAAHAQCKDEASEYTGFEGHGNADTPELKSVPEWLEEKMLKNDTQIQVQTKELIPVSNLEC